jgi:hypothetical protein
LAAENKINLETNNQSKEQLQSIFQKKTTGTLIGMKKKYEKIISLILMGIFLNIFKSFFAFFAG